MNNLDIRIPEINFYCKKIAKKLMALGLKTVRDLLFYYPFRYENFSQIKKINELLPGDIATVKVRVELLKNYRSPQKHKKITEAIMSDGTGKIKVLWFNQWYLTNSIMPGDELYLVAKISDNGFAREIISPEYEKFSKETTHTGRIVPIYPLTAGLSQKQLRTAIKTALENAENIEEYLPEEIIVSNNLLGLKDAIKNIHFPASMDLQKQAIKRLSFDELFFNQLNNLWLRKNLEKKKSESMLLHKEKLSEFTAGLPFRLTDAQRKAAMEIMLDLEKTHPMNRLLNGDVGSGKTVVAALAMYNTILSGRQSALLAPTEILATQHYNTFCKLFDHLNLKIALLTRSSAFLNNSAMSKKFLTEKIKKGGADIVIGTHAIIQKNITFKNLCLAVIDEQHRFGVEQRTALTSCSGNGLFPHLLSMTATPIPRTMAIVKYGDLDLSVLNEMPGGRKEIKTYAVRPERRAGAYNFIKKEVKSGRQVFVICPLIDESDKLGVKSVIQEFKKLKEQIFPEFNIAALHGKLKSAEKDEIMADFRQNKTNILVSTSVVEVGVDIQNATIMMVEGAERFGLAQLHQFRGRVGRGEYQSYCLLFPTNGEATSRLRALEKINNGFRLATIDLQLRGPGKIYGTEQSGKIDFQLADINNITLVKQTQDAVNNLFRDDPELKKYPHLREYLEERLKKIHLG